MSRIIMGKNNLNAYNKKLIAKLDKRYLLLTGGTLTGKLQVDDILYIRGSAFNGQAVNSFNGKIVFGDKSFPSAENDVVLHEDKDGHLTIAANRGINFASNIKTIQIDGSSLKTKIGKLMYPVGSIYFSVSPTNPSDSTLLGFGT